MRAVNGTDLFADSEKFCQKYTYRIVLAHLYVSKVYALIYPLGTIVRILNRQVPFPLPTRYGLRRRGAVPKAATGAERGRRA